MADAVKNDSVGLFLRAMVDREPGKRKVKPTKGALLDLTDLNLGESSDDSDFHVDESRLNEDDDISINSDQDDNYGDDTNENCSSDADCSDNASEKGVATTGLSVTELLERAKLRQETDAVKGSECWKILVCAVCLGDHSDDINEIVTCDGCSISVHEGCYGVSDTMSVSSTVSSCSTEPWFCDACKAGVTNPPCELCPNLGYTIFKETEMGCWVHLVCALYVPGVAFSEVDKLSFPTLFEMKYSLWGSKRCSLCEDERYSKTGICIGCDAGMCRAYFHVTCAQREGLLTEVNQGEFDQADPYYAHCKLHTRDSELIRHRKRNWLALQMHTRQLEGDKQGFSCQTHDRIKRKLLRYRDKYNFHKNSRPTPWYPTQKMPRSLTTCASLFRSLLRKTELMGLNTETEPEHGGRAVGDIRKKWHIPPAFSVEFVSYYLDRMTRLKGMKEKLDSLLKENTQLTQEESKLRAKYESLQTEFTTLKGSNESLLQKALELHSLLKGLAGRPLPLPPVVAALHNPPMYGGGHAQGPPRRNSVITKAAAKMMSDPLLDGNAMALHSCSVCLATRDQHLLISCDTCSLYYHLSCLDPPLSRMPKKTKQMGWQCSECCKSSDSEKASELDTMAPRKLRRNIKEPAKFSPSVNAEFKSVQEEHSTRDELYYFDDAEDEPMKSTKQRRSNPGSRKRGRGRRGGSGGFSPKGMGQSPQGKLVEGPTVGLGSPPDVTDSSRGKSPSKGRKLASEVELGPPSTPPSRGGGKVGGWSIVSVGETSLSSSSQVAANNSGVVGTNPLTDLTVGGSKKHRDGGSGGGKKKKRDREKWEGDGGGGRKRKKHHHREKRDVGEMESEIVTPFRIKIKTLPPRPNEEETTSLPSHVNPTTSAPLGYPPLPPGYTLTQPMVAPATVIVIATSSASPVKSPPPTSETPPALSPPIIKSSPGKMAGRRKSEPQSEQFSCCDVCKETGGVTNTVACDECHKAYHFNCLEPPLKKSPKRRGYSWFCEDCDSIAKAGGCAS